MWLEKKDPPKWNRYENQSILIPRKTDPCPRCSRSRKLSVSLKKNRDSKRTNSEHWCSQSRARTSNVWVSDIKTATWSPAPALLINRLIDWLTVRLCDCSNLLILFLFQCSVRATVQVREWNGKFWFLLPTRHQSLAMPWSKQRWAKARVERGPGIWSRTKAVLHAVFQWSRGIHVVSSHHPWNSCPVRASHVDQLLHPRSLSTAPCWNSNTVGSWPSWRTYPVNGSSTPSRIRYRWVAVKVGNYRRHDDQMTAAISYLQDANDIENICRSDDFCGCLGITTAVLQNHELLLDRENDFFIDGILNFSFVGPTPTITGVFFWSDFLVCAMHAVVLMVVNAVVFTVGWMIPWTVPWPAVCRSLPTVLN